jgi:hypothetical protein
VRAIQMKLQISENITEAMNIRSIIIVIVYFQILEVSVRTVNTIAIDDFTIFHSDK